MPFKVGVSTGIYMAARTEEISTVLRKLGAGLTMGTGAIEMAEDIPHEITITDGLAIHHMAKKQSIDITLHGPLTVPLCMPERGDWRDAHNHMQKAVRSAVYAGAKYVNHHTCLREWLELFTYAGSKLTITMCDHLGRFISEILHENERLRNWFVGKMDNLGDINYAGMILNEEEQMKIRVRVTVERGDRWASGEIEEKLEKKKKELGLTREPTTPEELKEFQRKAKELDRFRRDMVKEVEAQATKEQTERYNKYMKDEVRSKMASKDPKKRRWRIDNHGRLIDAYRIMGNYLFFTKDPMWKAMVEMYPELFKRYKIEYSDDHWLDKAWEKAEDENDREFKEFFYSVVAAKYFEGHMKLLIKWMDKDLPDEIRKLRIPEDDKQRILGDVKKLILCFETPDARDPQHGGMYLLWSPRQMYAAIKTTCSTLNTGRVMMLMDFEHVATQGVDAVKDMERAIEIAPDFGKYVFSVHADPPNPLHAMNPIDIGDVTVYKLLWYLRKTGFGKEGRTGYLIFERGGAKDPYATSVEALKLCRKYLELDVAPDDLPPEFYGIKGPVAGGFERQKQIIQDKAMEPLKDLLEMPEEEWGMLSQTAIRKGKKPEAWKKGELR